MSLSLYEYSQLCCVVEMLSFGISLLLIGNAKVRASLWLKWAKWAVALVFILVGTFTLVQYALGLNVYNPKLNTAFNVSTLYAVTMMFAVAFIPLADKLYTTRSRLYLTGFVFILCGVLVWLSLYLESSLATMLVVSSLALYLVELVRVISVFMVSYRALSGRRDELDADEEARYNYLTLLWRSVLFLSLFALMYVFLVLWSEQALAVYNFGSLVLWAYVFVTFVNLVVNYSPVQVKSSQNTDNKHAEINDEQYSVLKGKLDKWVSSRAYCQQGVTMAHVSQLLGTNRTYLSRYINSYYGCNFNAWLNRLRIDEAKRMMATSPTLSLEKMSQMLGFSSKSQFISSFKSLEGITPGQWREQHV